MSVHPLSVSAGRYVFAGRYNFFCVLMQKMCIFACNKIDYCRIIVESTKKLNGKQTTITNDNQRFYKRVS